MRIGDIGRNNFEPANTTNMELSKQERKLAREKIEDYHKKRLAEFFEYVLEKGNEYKQGKIDIFEMDYIVHIFHQQS